jgi:hypothetical protein
LEQLQGRGILSVLPSHSQGGCDSCRRGE